MSTPRDQHPTPVISPAVAQEAIGRATTPEPSAAATATPKAAATRPSWVMAADPALEAPFSVVPRAASRRRVIVAVAVGLFGAVVLGGGIAWVLLGGPDAMELYVRAKAHSDNGELTQALALVERGRRGASDPRVVALLTQLEREINVAPRLKIAEQLIASGQLAAARLVLQQALKKAPESDRARALLESTRAAVGDGPRSAPTGDAAPAGQGQGSAEEGQAPATAAPTATAPIATTRSLPAVARPRRPPPTRGRATMQERSQSRSAPTPVAAEMEAPSGPPPGTTVVRVRASEASTLSVDGQASGTTTPATLYLAPGMHRVEARGAADPTLRVERRIMVLAEVPVTIDLQLPSRVPAKRTIDPANPYREEK
ncbi:MAG: hypothetical protein IPL40_15875 [Proteobacteria bacterium]|nr:hypothetical protein [Pseudomonadota bacterium]